MEFIIGALSAALAMALIGLLAQLSTHKRDINLVLAQETRALDRARAAELRAAQQIDAMLDRIATAPRFELREQKQLVTPDPDAPKYITDTPYMDDAWNDYRGVEDEE